MLSEFLLASETTCVQLDFHYHGSNGRIGHVTWIKVIMKGLAGIKKNM